MTQDTREVELLQKAIERQDQLRNMHSRELLYRYGNAVAYRHNRLWMGVTDLADCEKEIREYEAELLTRLRV